jgi:hypothetical protein
MYFKNYLKYKKKYLELKKIHEKQEGGKQFFISMTDKPLTTVDTERDAIHDTDDLIARIREKFELPLSMDFVLNTRPPIKASTHAKGPLNAVGEDQKIVVHPIASQSVHDDDGTNTLTKLFSYLHTAYNNDERTQIIVVPFSSNTQYSEDDVRKNITQQFQHTNISPVANTIIYVLFDKAFFTNGNKDFFDFINFTNVPIDFVLSERERVKIKKYTKPSIYTYNITDAVSDKYCEYFKENVRELLEGKEIIFYVVNINIKNEEDMQIFKKGCSSITNCQLFSFEGSDFK